MNTRILNSLLLLLIVITGCTGTKKLPEGSLLYTGATIKIENTTPRKQKKALKTALTPLLRPKPNTTFLGWRPKLFFYNLAGEPTKQKGLRYWLRNKVGEPPILYSRVDLNYNQKIILNYVQNNGYFNAKVVADSSRSGKKATATYSLNPGKQYVIQQIKYPEDSSAVANAIRHTIPTSLLKIGQGYSLDAFKQERERIDSHLKEKGFYYFNAEYLKMEVDSTVAEHRVNLTIKIKPEITDIAQKQYQINQIMVYPNYRLNKDTIPDPESALQYKDFTIIGSKNQFKPRIFDRALYFHKGDLYNRTNHNLSLNRLVNLGTFKFVKNQFKVADTTANFLDVYYYLTPLPKKSIQAVISAKTNSANYTGTELNINWSNRNLFKGAELLNLSAFGGLEVQVSGQNKGFNVYRLGTEANLIWPRIIAPFPFKSASGFVPKTKATLGYEYQNRTQLYSLQTLKGSFGYLWKENQRKEHLLNVTEITYASPQNVTNLYRQQIAIDPSLAKVTEKQLIFGPTYSYTYTNTMLQNKKHTYYYKASLDLSANLTGWLSWANMQKGDTVEIFKVPFSQFIKIENEFRHYLKLSSKTQIASKILVGAGYAYGNSDQMPFIKQFFNGGSNSIRAFRARSIGPGSFNGNATSGNFLPDQSGDLKLEFSTEYRAKIYKLVHGALFLDAGNIWLLRETPEKPGAKFSKGFLKELAVGVGAGLRFDFSFLILRTDLAFPIRKPYLPEGARWQLDQISFGDKNWRKENLVFNLAIGYPF
ncbi:BamA/TamA family outer membrane protein [Flavobacterium crassostreae]|uniref:Bacterial surface antigen (D15) domain-containing protein n=1 Tax=Flavobacterium crassostreae TaxID=1763534 RepID=A0A1B9EA68_9FLAO|nr:BamA/TamA family outer membrane protein [Flavobacterium crassostreae]OCB78778.1 hypothetical protein LPBF_01960 [Flavobacterium crassostreae]